MKIIIWSLCIAGSFLCCKESGKKPDLSEKKFETMEQLQWLVGNWSSGNSQRRSYEIWTKENDSTLAAYNYTTVETDTVFVETVILQQLENDVFYTVLVPDQNDAQAVTFKLIPSSPGVFTFENKAHDFPQRISYSNPVKDSIHAWIDGMVDGKLKKVDFGYRRAH
jgi:hypothetical protein